MVQGNSIEFEGRDLVALRNYNGSCQILEMKMQCALYSGGFTCQASQPPCAGYPIIFIPRQQYLELRLMGEA
jgi:hypothetical protein